MVYKDLFKESMELLSFAPKLTEIVFFRTLRQEWAKFYADWNQIEGDRQLLGGGAQLESQDCLDDMQCFVELSNANATDASKWTTDSKIEREFTKARDAMRDYWLAILYRQFWRRWRLRALSRTQGGGAEAEC